MKMVFFQKKQTFLALDLSLVCSHNVKSKNIKITRVAVFILSIFATAPAGAENLSEPSFGTNNVRARAIDSEKIGLQKIELKGLETNLAASEAERRRIQTEIDSLKNNRTELTKALIEITKGLSAAESALNKAEAELETMKGSEESLQKSLNSRRAVISGIFVHLERLSRNPFPVFLANPNDVLKAISTSALLAGVLPKLRSEIEALGSDLNELARLRASVELTRDTMAQDAKNYSKDRQRLGEMIEARQLALTAAEKDFEAESIHHLEIAGKAANLKDLIKTLEENYQIPAIGGLTDDHRSDGEPRYDSQSQEKFSVFPFKTPPRLSPAIPFSQAKGLLPLPVAGSQIRHFGSPNGFGGSQKGILISTRDSAVVTSPCDGWIVFGGAYRTYGQLLIINAGQGYYVILAGMDRIDVNAGQFVLSGEPVAFMGNGTSKVSSAVVSGSDQPFLYVEFRKDGAAIDPGPWWVKPEFQKVRG